MVSRILGSAEFIGVEVSQFDRFEVDSLNVVEWWRMDKGVSVLCTRVCRCTKFGLFLWLWRFESYSPGLKYQCCLCVCSRRSVKYSLLLN